MKKCLLLLFIVVFSCQAKISVDKVVIPAAGFGTRFLPITKSTPKELLPLGKKPALQLIVEEAMDSGINHVISIISKRKQAIVDFFDPKKSEDLKAVGKYHMIAENDKIFSDITFEYINQKLQLGLGHAVLMAQEAIGGNYFGVMLPDELVFSDEDPALAQIIEIAKRENASVVAVVEVPDEKISSYGIVKTKEDLGDGLYELEGMVEKPALKDAPSNLALIGRYVLSPKVFKSLNILLENHTSGELQLTDAILHMMQESGEKVLAYKVRGERHDTGVPSGWVKAVIANSLRDPDMRDDVIKYFHEKTIKNLIADDE